MGGRIGYWTKVYGDFRDSEIRDLVRSQKSILANQIDISNMEIRLFPKKKIEFEYAFV